MQEFTCDVCGLTKTYNIDLLTPEEAEAILEEWQPSGADVDIICSDCRRKM